MIKTLQGQPPCVLAERPLSDAAGACDIWEWITRADMFSSSGSQFKDAEAGRSVCDSDGAVVLEASTSKWHWMKENTIYPWNCSIAVKRNARLGLWSQMTAFPGQKASHFKNARERTLRPLGNISTWNKMKVNLASKHGGWGVNFSSCARVL